MSDKPKGSVVHREAVKDRFDAAVEVEPPPDDQDSKDCPKPSERGSYNFPPVIPVGIDEEHFIFLDANKRYRRYLAKDFSRLGIQALFGAENHLLREYWPKTNDSGEPTKDWRQGDASMDLMASCARKGFVDLRRRRGLGGWGDDGSIVYNFGDENWRRDLQKPPGCEAKREPGVYVGFIYPADRPIRKPANGPVGTDPAERLQNHFKTWNLPSPDVYAYLLVGVTACALLGGAVDWQPNLWLTGPSACGKSTLLRDFEQVIGPDAAIFSTDASEAGIRQRSGFSSSAILMDEQEAGNKHSGGMMQLSRSLGGGARSLRGGMDNQPIEQELHGTGIFVAIDPPPMLNQDENRIIRLELKPLQKDQRRSDLSAADLNKIGTLLLRRLFDHYPRLAEVKSLYREALIAAGHDSRGADVFGWPLALAELLLNDDHPDTDFLAEIAKQLSPSSLADYAEQPSAERRCLDHLLSQNGNPYRRNSEKTIAQLIVDAAKADNLDFDPTNQNLGHYGLRVTECRGHRYLAVANRHPALDTIYEKTHWQGKSGADGVWKTALRRLLGTMADQRKFAGQKLSCTLIPLDHVIDEGQDD